MSHLDTGCSVTLIDVDKLKDVVSSRGPPNPRQVKLLHRNDGPATIYFLECEGIVVKHPKVVTSSYREIKGIKEAVAVNVTLLLEEKHGEAPLQSESEQTA